MPRPTTLLTLAALAAGPLLPPTTARADAPTPPPARALPPPPTAWAEPPEAVRATSAALRDACMAWPRQAPLPPDADASVFRRGKPAEAVVCDAALDPFGHTTEPMVWGGLFAAAAAGTALGTYAGVAALFRLLRSGSRRMAGAVWDLRARRRGWQE